nr:MAG TPA: hypothetical protein [Caudoviricetes sp.]DAH85806.1 MAG TPA: hypothetical protein [Bacteriophage sp.]
MLYLFYSLFIQCISVSIYEHLVQTMLFSLSKDS